ncbi:hypothetical protein QYF36_025457 [Acer negundo]|nr:hypothetical protein QYF36_025457 [Acer negundo]
MRAWKYGERSFRYCNHDVGNAIATVSMAAAGLGWDVKILDGLGHKDLEKLMGLDVFPNFEVPSKPIKGSGNGEKQKRPVALPFRVLSWDAAVHAVLFVHRVKGLPKGLYFLVSKALSCHQCMSFLG